MFDFKSRQGAKEFFLSNKFQALFQKQVVQFTVKCSDQWIRFEELFLVL